MNPRREKGSRCQPAPLEKQLPETWRYCRSNAARPQSPLKHIGRAIDALLQGWSGGAAL